MIFINHNCDTYVSSEYMKTNHFLFCFSSIMLTQLVVFLVLVPIAMQQSCSSTRQCSTTSFCSTRERICLPKLSFNSTCDSSIECTSGKCYDRICRQACHSDDDCLSNKEYCTLNKYCFAKHCNICFRNGQCANNDCQYFQCESTTCQLQLDILQN